MTSSDHLKAFFSAWMTHDAGKMAAFYADAALMEDPTLDQPREGRAAIERYYREMFSALEHPKHELVDHAARGNRIWFEWTFGSGGARQPRVSYHGVSIQTLEEGLVVHDAAFWSPRD